MKGISLVCSWKNSDSHSLPSGARSRMGNPWIKVKSRLCLGCWHPDGELSCSIRPQNRGQLTLVAVDACEGFPLAFFSAKLLGKSFYFGRLSCTAAREYNTWQDQVCLRVACSRQKGLQTSASVLEIWGINSVAWMDLIKGTRGNSLGSTGRVIARNLDIS